VRRFNAAFRERFGAAPSAIRRSGEAGSEIRLRLDFRPPLAWDAMLSFLGARALAGVERVENRAYSRLVRYGDAEGIVRVRREAEHELVAEVPVALARAVPRVASRLRRLFDLDARPDAIAACLRRDPVLAPRVERTPGLRVPGAFEPFEMAARAVLGQQVTVKAATTLAGRIVERLGGGVFPDAARLAAASEDELAAIGMPGRRAAALRALARAVADGTIDLDAPASIEATIERLEAIPGFGAWTASYVAMRALGWPDALPSGDLGVRKALDGATPREIERRAEAWRPWRAYGVLYLWIG
jgi:AraC family transcriptional regulator of adaptative response / DNA-3-methyladenine glycosylase II